MPKKAPFSLAQYEKLQAVTKKRNKKFETQKEHAAALGISQQSLSNLMSGTYRPGVKVADRIADLEGGLTIEQLVGEYRRPSTGVPTAGPRSKDPYPNLTACIAYHADDRQWPEWVIAAARGGFYGPADVGAKAWLARLNELEAQMGKARAAAK